MTSTAVQPSADFKVIAEPLDSLLSALENKIEREWPQRFAPIAGARELFLLTFRTANATYRSVRWLCAEKPPDPARRLDYCISVPPRNRTILDHLFTTLSALTHGANPTPRQFASGAASGLLQCGLAEI
jgi:hypothetical protein